MRKLIEKFKSLGQYFKKDEAGSNNLNAFIKTKQAIYGVVVIFLLIIFMITLHFLAASHHKKTPQINVVSKSPDGILSVDFSQKNSLSALEHQQLQIDGLHKQFHALMHSIIKEKEFKKRNATQVHQQLKKPTLLVQPIPTIQPTQPVKPERALHSILFHYQKTQIRRVEKHSINKSDKNVKTWVPAGTFARAVLLEGADANASVNGQSDTVPILMRFLDQG